MIWEKRRKGWRVTILSYNYMQMNEHTHAASGRDDNQSHAEVHPQAPPHAKQQPAAKLPVKTQV